MFKLVVLIIGICGVFSCTNTEPTNDSVVKSYNETHISTLKNTLITIEIDSCEYLAGHAPIGDMGWIMAHKGNCKFCIARNKHNK